MNESYLEVIILRDGMKSARKLYKRCETILDFFTILLYLTFGELLLPINLFQVV